MGKSGARRRGTRPGHRRVQHHVHAHGLPGAPTTPARARFKCPCHFSMFDAEKGGQMICGQATENLPRIVLRYNAQGRSRHRGGRRRPDLRPPVQRALEEERTMATQRSHRAAAGQCAEDQPDLPLLHRRLRLPRLQVGREPEGGRAPAQNALGLDFRKQLPPLAVIMTPAMTNVDHRQGRQALQRHDRAGQGLLGEPGPVLHARRQDGLVHVHRRRASARSGCRTRASTLGDQWLDTSWDNALARLRRR